MSEVKLGWRTLALKYGVEELLRLHDNNSKAGSGPKTIQQGLTSATSGSAKEWMPWNRSCGAATSGAICEQTAGSKRGI